MKPSAPYLMITALLLSLSARSQELNSGDRPYASIVERNMFGLLPIPPPPPVDAQPPPDPPPKITANGIMTIFGRDQALFKVTNRPKPGQSAPKEDSYVLAEGERQDDIEVVKIDHVNGLVTFNNHGAVQVLSLTPADSATGAPGGPGAAGVVPGMPTTPMSPFERAALRRAQVQGRTILPGNPGVGNPQGNQGGAGGMNFGGGAPLNPVSPTQSESENLSPEQQVLLIEAQRMKYLQEGSPLAPLLPTTPLTKQNMDENGPPPP